jgi:predicted MPP superfamily phosphohydrolase
LEGLRIIQVSDLHCRWYGRREKQVGRLVQQGCDLLMITGDCCQHIAIGNPLRHSTGELGPVVAGVSWRGVIFPANVEMALEICRRMLAGSSGRLGSFAVQGNHDPDEFMAGLDELGVTVLANESRRLEIKGAGLNVCGVQGCGREATDVPATVEAIDSDSFTIALSHYPELAESLAAAGADLILAGHTHGGQICLPGSRPLVTHSRTGARYATGLERLGKGYVCTSRGLGTTVIPIRLFCPPEVLRFTLCRGEYCETTVTQQGL